MIAPSVPSQRAASPSSLVGQSLEHGRYVVTDELGAGGMGEVYRARDTRLNRDVAIKRMAPRLREDPEARARFLREVRRTSRLDDPHLAVVHDVLEENGHVFLVLELVHGQTLRERLADGPLALDEFLSVGIQSARALAAAHAHAIVHCDLKPENIMLTPNGHLKVLDFGLARALPRKSGPEDLTLDPNSVSAPSPTDENRGAGTALYMSPEALRGEPCDEKSDLFALGVVLYEAWTGRHPFRGANAFVTSDHILHDPPPRAESLRPETPAGLDDLFTRLLAKERAGRPANAAEVLKSLQEIARDRPGVLDPHPVPIAPPRPRPIAPLLLLFLLAVSSTGAVLGLNPAWRHGLARMLGIEHPLPARRLLAVLPFTAAGGDSSARALADGLTYALTGQLTQAQPYALSFHVAPASDVIRERVRSSQAAHKQLGATLTVEGNVQRLASGLRVICTLVDPVAGIQLRSCTVNDPAPGEGLIQDLVARRVAEMIELDAHAQEHVVTRGAHKGSPRANAFYLEGRGLLADYNDPARIERARALFGQALALDSALAPAWAGLGQAEWELWKSSKDDVHVAPARSAFETAVRLAPELSDGHVGLGEVQAGTGFPETAIREFKAAIGLDAANDLAYRGLALAYQKLDRPTEAESAYREAIALRTDYWGGYSALGAFYYHVARYPEAIGMFRRVTELAPGNASGWRNLGSMLSLYPGRRPEAVAALRHSITLRPDYITYNSLAALLYYDGRLSEAAEMYGKALELNRQDYRVWGTLADCVRHMPGKASEARLHYEEAIRRAEHALETDPRDATALACLAEFHADLDHRPEAMRRLAEALRIRPNDPELNFRAVVVCERLGDRAGAITYLRRSLEQGYALNEFEHDPDLAALRLDPDVKKALAKRG